MKKTFKETLDNIRNKYLKTFGKEVVLINYDTLTPELLNELKSLNKYLVSININPQGKAYVSLPFPTNEEEAIEKLNNYYLSSCERFVCQTPFRDRMVSGLLWFRDTNSRAAQKVTASNLVYNNNYETDLFQEKYMGGFFGQLAGDAFHDYIFPLDSPEIYGILKKYKLYYDQNKFNHWTEIKGEYIPPDSIVTGKYWDEGFSIALCTAESLTISRGFNAEDLLSQFLRYTKFGHCGPNFLSGVPLEYQTKNDVIEENFYIENIIVSNSLKKSMQIYEQALNIFSGVEDEDSETLMRILPITLYYLKNPIEAIEYAGLSSQVTHKSIVCRDACRYLSSLLIGAIQNIPKEELLSSLWAPVNNYWDDFPLCKAISKIAQGNFKNLAHGQVKSEGFVLDSLNLALSAFFHTTNFDDGFKWVVENSSKQSKAANMYGCLAGAFYGFSKMLKYYVNVHGKTQIKSQLVFFHTAVHQNLTEEERIKAVQNDRESLIYHEMKYPHKPPFTFGENYPRELGDYVKKRNVPMPPPDPRIEKFKKMSVENLFEEKK